MDIDGSARQKPHALMFPFPAQGHVNPMIQLAKRLLDEGFSITFVNNDYNHHRMFCKKGGDLVAPTIPNLRFEHVSDGLPEKHQRFNEQPNGVVETVAAVSAMAGPLAKLVRRIVNSDEFPPLTCIITDALCTWVQDVADQFQIPRVSLWTTPVHANLAYTFQGSLQSLGLIPAQGKGRLQEIVQCIDGITPMKLEDYISFFLVDSTADFMYQWFLMLALKRPDEAVWNLGNNFEELEHEASAAFRKEVPNFLPIGPLVPTHILRGEAQTIAPADIISVIWPEDAMCSEWLSQHAQASVIYISFGSIVNMPEKDVRELILGLEASGAPFLWAVRPDQISASLSQLREKLDSEAVEGKPSRRGLVIPWASQLTILTHPSVGLFLSHCGWNSVTESIATGVPILAMAGAGFAEQRMNAHYVADVWKIGHRLPNGAASSVVTSLIRSLLGSSLEAARMQKSLSALRQTALAALLPSDGSSYSNFKLFTADMYRRAAAC